MKKTWKTKKDQKFVYTTSLFLVKNPLTDLCQLKIALAKLIPISTIP